MFTFRRQTKEEVKQIRDIIQEKVLEGHISNIINNYKQEFDNVLKLQQFEEYCESIGWNWYKISAMTHLSTLFLDKYCDKIDWRRYFFYNLYIEKNHKKYLEESGKKYVIMTYNKNANLDDSTITFKESNFCDNYEVELYNISSYRISGPLIIYDIKYDY